MKKILYALLFVFSLALISTDLSAQRTAITVDLFCEDFDTTSTEWLMIPSCEPSAVNPPCNNPFTRDTVVTNDKSRGAATAFINPNAQSYLTTPSIALDTFITIGIQFDHIAYIDENDDAAIEYSFNREPWARLPASTYNGIQSRYDWFGDLKFDKRAEVLKWRFQDSSWIIPPGGIEPNGETVWITETFDLTDLIGTLGLRDDTIPDSLRIRMALIDDATPGRTGNHRWVIDNFCIRGADCELVPPQMTYLDPPKGYPQRYEDRVYLLGPYNFDAQVLDNTGVDTVFAVVSLIRLNGSTSVWDTLINMDTIPLNRLPGNNFSGFMPKKVGNVTVTRGDSIFWKVVAIDRSDCGNMTQTPSSGFSKFMAINDLPPSCTTQPIFRFPYVQDFNGNGFTEGSTNLAGNWGNVRGDFNDWQVGRDTTPTANTGPSDDIPGGGNYLYVEPSPNLADSTAFLVTPCFDLNEDSLPNGVVRFYVNMHTNWVADTLRVDVFDPTPLQGQPFGRFVEDVVAPIIGKKDDEWVPIEFSTFPFRNTVTQFRFRATPSTNLESDMAIDSFFMAPAPLIDLRLNAIDLAPFSPATVPQDPVVILQNLGVNAATGVTFQFRINKTNGSNLDSFSAFWPGTIGVGETQTITLPGRTYDVPEGPYEYKAWLEFPGDGRALNDTVSSFSEGRTFKSSAPALFKYMDNFDGKSEWTSSEEQDLSTLVNQWQLGTPDFGRTASAFTEPNSWDILLNRPYTGSGITNTIMSPFLDFSNAEDVILSFVNNRNIDTTQDGMWVQYSLDRGLTWHLVTQEHDPGRIRWYNSSLSGGELGGTPVFAKNTSCHAYTWKGGWLESEMYLPPVLNNQPEVLLRFAFFAEDDFSGNDGISIDDLLIYDPRPDDIQPQFIVGPNSKCDMSDSTRVNFIMKNRGLNSVSSFEVEYRLTHNGSTQVETDQINVPFNRPFDHRDTMHIRSMSTLDFFDVGDYELEVIAKLPGDDCNDNDTLRKFIENIDGCSLRFVMALSPRFNNRQAPCDSGVWRFSYTSGNREYEVAGAYNDPNFPIGRGINPPTDTIRDLFVCIKHDSKVRFDINDRDTLVGEYSFIAYDGDNDTIIRDRLPGGPDAPTQFFDWICPVEVSAVPRKIFIDNDRVQLPVAKEYVIEVLIENDGLDSIDNIDVTMQLDNQPTSTVNATLIPDLKFRRKRRITLDTNLLLTSGPHCITVWTGSPNGLPDQAPNGDTIQRCFTILDTIAPPFCEDFEGNSGVEWLSFNSYTYSQEDVIFERGVPNSPNINTAASGTNVWATNLDGDYKDRDSSSLLTPFIFLDPDSCYVASFSHNYYITDSIHDGGTFQVTTDKGQSWQPVASFLDTFRSVNWYNTLHILSIQEARNSGWSKISNGWIQSSSIIDPDSVQGGDFVAFRWRFQSDGSKTSDGWAIDDFCFETTDPSQCFPVGINEIDIELSENEFYLGQNIPNPANYSTEIPYHLPRAGEVSFVVSNLLGQPVYEEYGEKPSGTGVIRLDLADLSKGIYYYWMMYEGERITKKMIIAK